jgi:hypothetical protein
MTRTDLTKTSQSGAHHARLDSDWYLSNSSLESGCAPLVERRRFGRALMRAIKGVSEYLRARRGSLTGRRP